MEEQLTLPEKPPYIHPDSPNLIDFLRFQRTVTRFKKLKATMLEKLDPKKDDVIADLGCGLGDFVRDIARRAKRAIGLDRNGSVIYAGKEETLHSGLRNVALLHRYADQVLPFRDEELDGITADKFLQFVPAGEPFKRTLKQILRVLKIGGKLVVGEVDWLKPLADKEEPKEGLLIMRDGKRYESNLKIWSTDGSIPEDTTNKLIKIFLEFVSPHPSAAHDLSEFVHNSGDFDHIEDIPETTPIFKLDHLTTPLDLIAIGFIRSNQSLSPAEKDRQIAEIKAWRKAVTRAEQNGTLMISAPLRIISARKIANPGTASVAEPAAVSV